MEMAEDCLIEVSGLSKLYARSPSDARIRAARVFGRVWLGGRSGTKIGKLRPSEFWALKDVGFRVRRGESLGIIGLNGSGKTTLLRMLAGQLLPDEGEIYLKGTTASLIDSTAGFRMNATGRENIFLKGALLGRSKKEMAAAYDDLVAFTELGEAIDAPISSYSAGMLMRLAFAVNTAVAPDILFIDETLSVGDFRFRQKCLARLREMRERCCFVLVSHSMSDIKKFCSRSFVLHKGRIVFEGYSEDAVTFYESMEYANKTEQQRYEVILKPWYHNSDIVTDLEHYWCDANGQRISDVRHGEPLHLYVSLTLAHTPRQLVLGVPVWNEAGQLVTGFSTEITGNDFAVEAGNKVAFRLEVPELCLNPGRYVSNLGIMDGAEYLVRADNPTFSIHPGGKPFWGLVSLPHSWHRAKVRELPHTFQGKKSLQL